MIRTLGYTIVEVMMALAVLSVGATGVIAMQKAAIVGNMQARNLAAGNAIAAAWMERLRVDALRWKDENGINTITTKTTWLKQVGQGWVLAAAGPQGVAHPSADIRGMDVVNLPANEPAFCTHVRITQLLDNMVRAEVRVFWLRTHGTAVSTKYAGTINADDLCSADTGYIAAMDSSLIDNQGPRGRYHFVYLATALLRNDTSH